MVMSNKWRVDEGGGGAGGRDERGGQSRAYGEDLECGMHV